MKHRECETEYRGSGTHDIKVMTIQISKFRIIFLPCRCNFRVYIPDFIR